MERRCADAVRREDVSVLFNEPKLLKYPADGDAAAGRVIVSVLFNEPKLLKSPGARARRQSRLPCFSALQRAEIAEIQRFAAARARKHVFQCSSTSRNC